MQSQKGADRKRRVSPKPSGPSTLLNPTGGAGIPFAIQFPFGRSEKDSPPEHLAMTSLSELYGFHQKTVPTSAFFPCPSIHVLSQSSGSGAAGRGDFLRFGVPFAQVISGYGVATQAVVARVTRATLVERRKLRKENVTRDLEQRLESG